MPQIGFCHSGDPLVGVGGQLVLRSFLTPKRALPLPANFTWPVPGAFSLLSGSWGPRVQAHSWSPRGSLRKETARGRALGAAGAAGAAPRGSLLHAAAPLLSCRTEARCRVFTERPAAALAGLPLAALPESHWLLPSVRISALPSSPPPHAFLLKPSNTCPFRGRCKE